MADGRFLCRIGLFLRIWSNCLSALPFEPDCPRAIRPVMDVRACTVMGHIAYGHPRRCCANSKMDNGLVRYVVRDGKDEAAVAEFDSEHGGADEAMQESDSIS
uniref:Uncharacterized protein n=1 Tax=Oryza rufipogon TaxID=4529 RepID=A0A0E0RDM8_ORYRU